MTDWTTPEDVPHTTVERLHRWLLQEGNPEDAATPGERAVADIIRAFWPVPPPTLSERLQYRAVLLDNGDPDGDTPQALRDLADRAAQMEHDLTEARAEVERLTAERDRIASGRHITYVEMDGKPVQKGAESNAETPDPADVNPGEAWLVRDEQELSVAVRDAERWVLIHLNDATIRYRRIQHITLVARLVPEVADNE